MKRKNMIKIVATSLASFVLLSGCSKKGGSGNFNVNYTGTIDLAPIYKMLVYSGSWDGNESNLPLNHTFTDVNGSYSLLAPEGSTLTVRPISFTKTIATSIQMSNPDTQGSNFSDKEFIATVTSISADIVMSDTTKNKVKNLNQSQLWSLYRATDESNITTKVAWDENTTIDTAKRLAYKEARDAQDYALKTLVKDYVLESNNTIYGDVVETKDNIASLDRLISGYITDSWLEATKDNNVSIDNANVIKGVISSTISKYNAQNELTSNRHISTLDGTDLELKDYASYIGTAIASKVLHFDGNATSIYENSKKVYAGVLTLDSTIKATASLIDINISKSKKNKALAPLLYNAYVNAFAE